MSLGTALTIIYLSTWTTGYLAGRINTKIGYFVFWLIGVAAFFWVWQEAGA